MWFTLGTQEVLKGWDKGLQNMCTGERRKLTIPPSLAYGKEGKGKVTQSTLVGLHKLSFFLWPICVSCTCLYLQAKSLQAAPSFLKLSSWIFRMVPDRMSLSDRWISTMTGNSPEKRCHFYCNFWSNTFCVLCYWRYILILFLQVTSSLYMSYRWKST